MQNSYKNLFKINVYNEYSYNEFTAKISIYFIPKKIWTDALVKHISLIFYKGMTTNTM